VNHQSNGSRIPFSIIKEAVKGDTTAIKKVLARYEGYILKLSLKRFQDKDGKLYEYVDEDMRCQLQTKLMLKISKFKLY
jgi:hypothetical protein